MGHKMFLLAWISPSHVAPPLENSAFLTHTCRPARARTLNLSLASVATCRIIGGRVQGPWMASQRESKGGVEPLSRECHQLSRDFTRHNLINSLALRLQYLISWMALGSHLCESISSPLKQYLISRKTLCDGDYWRVKTLSFMCLRSKGHIRYKDRKK